MINTKKDSTIALKKAQSSLKTVITMLEEDAYCMDILQQILAVNGLLKSATNKILENHLNTCFYEGLKSRDVNVKNKLIREIVDVVNQGSKK